MPEQMPTKFGPRFLEWFRQKTEQAWIHYPVQDLAKAGKLGRDWQPGTRWLGGLSSAAINEIEQRWQVHFPPDYRVFLQRLHALDRPMVSARFADGSRIALSPTPSFYNWLGDPTIEEDAFYRPVEGILFDVHHNDLWLPSWGKRPASAPEREKHVRALVAQAPILIPVFAHRYLLGEPCQSGNPVFSIHQSDIIVYGTDLRQYLLAECASLLRIVPELPSADEAIAMVKNIPFWGDLWSYANASPG